MNHDFDALADQVATAAAWATSPNQIIAAAAAYREIKDQQAMNTETPKMHTDFYKLLMASTRACSLAFLAINTARGNEVLQKLAQEVLHDWGMDLPLPKDPQADPKPAAPPELIWPPVDRFSNPLETTLSPIYFEHYYHVHESLQRLNSPATSSYLIYPEAELRLLSAYWLEEERVWKMQFFTGVGEDWISHSRVHPGKKIAPAEAPL